MSLLPTEEKRMYQQSDLAGITVAQAIASRLRGQAVREARKTKQPYKYILANLAEEFALEQVNPPMEGPAFWEKITRTLNRARGLKSRDSRENNANRMQPEKATGGKMPPIFHRFREWCRRGETYMPADEALAFFLGITVADVAGMRRLMEDEGYEFILVGDSDQEEYPGWLISKLSARDRRLREITKQIQALEAERKQLQDEARTEGQKR